MSKKTNEEKAIEEIKKFGRIVYELVPTITAIITRLEDLAAKATKEREE